MWRETLEGHAGGAVLDRDGADPGGLAIVVHHRLAHLLAEHAAFGHDGQVEGLGHPGVDLDPAWNGLERRHRGAESRLQTLPVGLGQPGGLQWRDEVAVAQHRAEHRHRLLGRTQVHGGVPERRRCLRHLHLEDGRRIGLRPDLKALEQLHAAQRKRQRTGVAQDIPLERARVEQGDLGMGQGARGQQCQGEPDRTGSDHGDANDCARGHRVRIIGSARLPG